MKSKVCRSPGRPTKFKPEFVKIAFGMALLGATDEQLAEAFDVALGTIANWKKSEPEFRDALKRGKGQADAAVVRALYRRAIGFRRKSEKIFFDAKRGQVVRVECTEYFPPETTAGIYWLKNRQPERWRENRQPHNDAGGVRVNVYIDEATEALCGPA